MFLNKKGFYFLISSVLLSTSLLGQSAEANTMTFTIDATTVPSGSLQINVQTTPNNLGNVTIGATAITANFGTVEVVDTRGGTTGWVASVIASAMTNSVTPGNVIIPSAMTYTTLGNGTPLTIGTITLTPATVTDLTGERVIMTATGVSGNTTTTWYPTLTIAIPAGAIVGIYTGTITQSVA